MRQITEILIAQIGRRPISSKNDDKESYSLSAGFALGLVNLGSGSELTGMNDLNIDERLIRFVQGGKTMTEVSSMYSSSEQEQCSSVKEGENVNLYVTLPGGLVALALIHLKTNNKQIADRIELPNTFFALEYSGPRSVLLKVLCKNLIMWDSIQSSKDWVKSQIPDIIREIYEEKEIEKIEKKFQTRVSLDEIDFANIAMSYTFFLTGALFSIGFKYAGSGNRDVFKFLSDHVEKMIKMKRTSSNNLRANIAPKYTNANKNDIDERTYQTCLCVSAYALSMVMAGTGDVDCFVLLRRIRKIVEKDMNYGFNIAIHTAIGFLFLGSGKYTFSTSNLSIATLLMSLYPQFPEHQNDNRYHLQALRHLYVLAVENRLLQTIDIETGQLVSVPLEIEYKEEKKTLNSFVDSVSDVRSVKTPIMLEDMHKISRIHLKDEMYYEVIIDKPDSVSHLQKGSHSVFARASHLVDKSEFAQKSISKISLHSPFEVNLESQGATGWIPKMIFVKKSCPADLGNSNNKVSLAPLESSKHFVRFLHSSQNQKSSLNESEDAEGEEDENEEEEQSDCQITLEAKLNQMYGSTKNSVIVKFLDYMCQYTNLYSDLEPTMVKGMFGLTKENKSYTDILTPDDYFDLTDETEELVEDFDSGLKKDRLSAKMFSLSVLSECFVNNKLEVLPIYLKLFGTTMNSCELSKLTQQAKLICMFYKGLYQKEFLDSSGTEYEEDDEEMDDVSQPTPKILPQTLMNKQFIEELEEVLNVYNSMESDNLVLTHMLSNSSSVAEIDLEEYSKMKINSTQAQLLSLLVLLKITQGLDLQKDKELISTLLQQKFGSGKN